MALYNYNYQFNITNAEGAACLLEYATATPPVSGAANYGTFSFTIESAISKTFTWLNTQQSTVTCYATLTASGKAKSAIGSATYTL